MWATLNGQLPTLLALVASLGQLPFSSAAPNCPLIGPEYPAPYNLEGHPIWKAAIQNITNVFQFIDDTNITGVDLFSYSLQIFSTNPGSPIVWERHRTAKDLPKNTTGVKKVDGDTVYRLGSVSKVLTVLTFLAEAGDVYWNTPVTKFIPELAKFVGRSSQPGFDPVRETDWDDITIGALASQVSGLGRDCKLCSECSHTIISKCSKCTEPIRRWSSWRDHRDGRCPKAVAGRASRAIQLITSTVRSMAFVYQRT